MVQLAVIAALGPFLGRFHPVLVHLPIGILIVAVVLDLLSLREKFAALRPAVQPVLLLGAISAALSSITGYLLSQEGGYPDDTLALHQWLGIAVAVISTGLYVAHWKLLLSPKISAVISVLLLIVITVTGHLGGSLTHGADYLTEYSPFGPGKTDSVYQPKPIKNLETAIVYADVVDPILHQKCYSCHSASKQKGNLRMDSYDLLLKGGKNGEVLKIGDAKNSEMLKRVALPISDDKHMPPKEKPQLSKDEVALLHWWIEKGADRGKAVAATDTSAQVKKWILGWQAAVKAPVKRAPIIPQIEVPEPDAAAVKALQSKNIVVLPAGKDSRFLSVNFINAPQGFASVLPELQKLKQQVVWLKLGGTDVNDAQLSAIAAFPNLLKLHLENTLVTDAGVQKLGSLKNLEYLNLVGTKVNGAGLEKLKGLKKLKEIYLYKTSIAAAQMAKLKQQMPKVMMDTGGYQVPLLAVDTTILKK